MDKFVTDKSLLPQEQQRAIDKRLEELHQKAIIMQKEMPNDFQAYIDKAKKECKEAMREMIEKSTDVCNDKKALSYIFVLHKEREKDLNNLEAKFMPQRKPTEPLQGHTEALQTSPEPQQIPQGLRTGEAMRYFEKAIELGLMDAEYKWLKGKQMMACFAREMSRKLKLGKGERISWKPFEILFGMPSGSLRLNYNDIQKTGQEPSEGWLIDKVFE